MTNVGFYKEYNLYANNGPVADNINEVANYRKGPLIAYLEKQKMLAGCPKKIVDQISGKKINDSFLVYTDGEYEWPDFLTYYILNYNVKIPKGLIKKANAEF